MTDVDPGVQTSGKLGLTIAVGVPVSINSSWSIFAKQVRQMKRKPCRAHDA
jgi:hypothetical protein